MSRKSITAKQAAVVRDLGTQVDAAEAAEGLSAKDREALASHECVLCGAKLLALEVGRHYRLKHPNDRPEVRPL